MWGYGLAGEKTTKAFKILFHFSFLFSVFGSHPAVLRALLLVQHSGPLLGGSGDLLGTGSPTQLRTRQMPNPLYDVMAQIFLTKKLDDSKSKNLNLNLEREGVFKQKVFDKKKKKGNNW